MSVKKLGRLTSAAAVLLSLSVGAANAASSPTGVWIDHTGRGGVEIKDCGNGKLCGHVVWLKDQSDSKGCGLQILGNVRSVGGGQWDNGWIYSPEKKQKFSVELTPLGDDRLRVMGYKGIKLLSKTMIWHRASDSLERCGQTTTARKTAPTKPQASEQTTSPKTSKTAAVPKPRESNPSADDRGDVRVEGDQQANTGVPATSQDRHTDAPSSENARRQADNRSDDDIYAVPPRDNDRRARADRDDDDDRDDGEGIDGLAALFDKFTSDDGIEVGGEYGMKVEKGPNGEKNCRLDVPFVTVKFPCKD